MSVAEVTADTATPIVAPDVVVDVQGIPYPTLQQTNPSLDVVCPVVQGTS